MKLPFLKHALQPRAPSEPRVGMGWNVLAVAVVTLLSVLAITWTLDRIEVQIADQVAEALRTVVATARAGITLWVDDIKSELSVLAQSPELTSAVEHQLELARAATNGLEPVQELTNVLKPLLDLRDYTGFSLVAPGGAEIARFGEEPQDTTFAPDRDGNMMQAAFAGEIAVRLSRNPATDARATLAAAVPIRNRTREITAVLVLLVDPTKGLTDMTRLGRPGATGETYVFDGNGQLLTASRFAQAAANAGAAAAAGQTARKSPSTRITADTWLDEPTPSSDRPITVDIDGYADYRGVPVVGAWTWVSEPGVGIATELDRDEAFRSYRTIRAVTLLMLAAIGVSLAALLALLFNRGRVLASNFAFSEAAKARKEALAVVSHDLRSPLGTVLLCSRMLSTSADEGSRNRIASIIQRSGALMESLIADLLDVAELENGRLRIEPRACEVRPIFDDVYASFADEAKARSITLEVGEASGVPRIFADPGRVVQVLSNLVGNALKFTPHGGKVCLRATTADTEVRFEVSDSGSGISAEDLPHIFEQFWKAGRSQSAGRGLGLYIARMLVEHQGGRIWVETSAQQGTAFYCTLPRETPH